MTSSPQPLTPGKHTIEVAFTPDSSEAGLAGRGHALDRRQEGRRAGRIDEQIPMRCGTETMDVGMDCVSPVCDDYGRRACSLSPARSSP